MIKTGIKEKETVNIHQDITKFLKLAVIILFAASMVVGILLVFLEKAVRIQEQMDIILPVAEFVLCTAGIVVSGVSVSKGLKSIS